MRPSAYVTSFLLGLDFLFNVALTASSLGLHYSLVYIYDSTALQLLLGPILPPVHEVNQQVITGEIGDLKHEGGDLLDVIAYAPCLLQVPKLASCLVQDIIWQELALELGN